MTTERKKDIRDFVNKISQKYGQLPKFAHNIVNSDPNKVYYSGPYFDDNELVAAIETFLFGKWSSSGEVCVQFEKEFSKKINQKYSFFTNSGSSANLLLITSCKEYFNWTNNDEIIVSPVGFPTTISPIVQNNLKPVFIDIEWNTLNFDLNLIEQKITNETRAIFLSPVLGNPPDIDRILHICDKYKIILLLDNCDSLGSKWEDKYLNEYAVASSCSFYPAHEICTLEGGMVSSDIYGLVKSAKSFATWGRECFCSGVQNLLPNGMCKKRFSNWIDSFPDLIIDHKYVFDRIGYNLKPLDFQGAIGLEQLKKVESFYEKRRENLEKIQNLFISNEINVSFPIVLEKTHWVPFGVPLICKSKEEKIKLVNFLESRGIQTRNYFAGNLLIHKGYKHLDDYKKYPEANKVLDLVFFIGCAPTISDDNINYINKVLKEYKNA